MPLPPGTHLCLNCQETPLPEQRIGERHVASRFGDYGWRVYYGDHEVSNYTTEAFAGQGEDGWILRLCAEKHPCQQCGRAACMWLARGDVRIERMA